VIIPVGPGHEELHKAAVLSVKIASDNPGVFDQIKVLVANDIKGEIGRSAARNGAVLQSDEDSDWLFFLDADDLMHPEAFESVSELVKDVMVVAIFGNIWEMREGVAHWRYQVPIINYYRELLRYDPYLTLQMGHFVRREVAIKLPFNEEMNTGEDWDYYLRLWKGHDCIKIREPLMLNRRGMHSTGPRSATGRDWTIAVNKMIEEARNEQDC